jgi:hypothetical protein
MSAGWKSADVGRREPGQEVPRLMHIECPDLNKRPGQRFLEKIYSTNHQKQLPLDIKMRCNMHEAVGMYGQDKTQKLLDRHTSTILYKKLDTKKQCW